MNTTEQLAEVKTKFGDEAGKRPLATIHHSFAMRLQQSMAIRTEHGKSAGGLLSYAPEGSTIALPLK